MSQILDKPILLDETGQDIASKINGIGGKLDSQTTGIGNKLDTNSAAIVNKLNDIKEAIGTSSEFIPVMIKIVTPPTKTLYNVGERLNLSGMVVNLVGTNGVQIDVTQACTFVPANNTVLTAANTSVAITYHYAADNIDFSTSQALSIRALDSIAVTTPPIKTAYQTGETLDLTGIVVTATYTDGFTANVTSDCTFVPQNGTVLSSGDTSVTVTYTEGGITETTTVAIGVKELSSIAVTHLPTKTSYRVGETLDLTGIVVTATYDDSSTLDVTNNCTFSPDNGDTLSTSDTSVSISYTEGSTTKTTSQVITVVGLSSIAVTTPPTKTSYVSGDTLDLTGIVVTATYSDSSTDVVTSSCTFSPANGATVTGNDTVVTVSFTDAGTTKTTTQALSVAPIVGAEWDGTASTSWSRTDDAANFTDPNPYYSGMSGTPSSPFDTIQPWAGMARVEDNAAGSLVSIPKFYYKLTKDGAKIKIQISPVQISGYHVSPAHMDRGDGIGERDVVYVGRYQCASTYKSTSGVAPQLAKKRSAYRTSIHNLGTDIWQWDFATLFTIWLLYLVEYANWDSQTVIGAGGGNGSYVNTGYTDNMPYHTGTTESNRSDAGGVQYRYIEGLWSNGQPWVDGCFSKHSTSSLYIQHNGLYIILNPSSFREPSSQGAESTGINVGIPFNGSNGGVPTSFDVVDVSGTFPLLLPTAAGESYTSYTCDHWSYAVNQADLITGGSKDSGAGLGLFCIGNAGGQYGDTAPSSSAALSRLMKLPANS